MIVTLRQARERLSELVEHAYQGEDVLITVRGKMRARLTRVLPNVAAHDRQAWVAELRQLHAEVGHSKQTLATEDILSEHRQR